MSILTTSAARSRSYLHRRNGHDPVMMPLSRRRASSAQSDPGTEWSDDRGMAPVPHAYEQRYDISLGYDDGRQVIIP